MAASQTVVKGAGARVVEGAGARVVEGEAVEGEAVAAVARVVAVTQAAAPSRAVATRKESFRLKSMQRLSDLGEALRLGQNELPTPPLPLPPPTTTSPRLPKASPRSQEGPSTDLQVMSDACMIAVLWGGLPPPLRGGISFLSFSDRY